MHLELERKYGISYIYVAMCNLMLIFVSYTSFFMICIVIAFPKAFSKYSF